MKTIFFYVRIVMESGWGGTSRLVEEYLTDAPPMGPGTHYELQREDEPDAGVVMTLVSPAGEADLELDLPCYFRGKRIR